MSDALEGPAVKPAGVFALAYLAVIAAGCSSQKIPCDLDARLQDAESEASDAKDKAEELEQKVSDLEDKTQELESRIDELEAAQP